MTAPNIVDPNSTELTPPAVTQNTETPPSSSLSVDTTGQELFLSALREQHQEVARLRAELAEKNKAPRQTGDAAWVEMTNDPRKVIQEEVREAVKPLNDFIESLKNNNKWAGLKQQASSINPQYARVLEKAGAYVDSALANAVPNIDNVIAAINLVAGAIAMGQIKGLTAADLLGTVTPPTPTTVPTPTRTVPPSISPSASPIIRSTERESAKPWEDLTETQLAMARHFRMTPQQYWEQLQGEVVAVDPTKGGGKK